MREKYKNMKFISWNVNGIRACITKGFEERFHELDADIFCLQETKCQQGQVKLELPGYHQYWNYANRRGYSGTIHFTKREPLSAAYGIGIEEHDKEGRCHHAEFDEYYFVTVYTPTPRVSSADLEYRMKWEEDFLAYLPETAGEETGDLLWRPLMWHIRRSISRTRRPTAKMQALLMKREPALPEPFESGFIDTFRYFIRIKRGRLLLVVLPFPMHERRTPAGVSTISLFPFPGKKSFRMRRSTERSCGSRIIARMRLDIDL